MKKTTYLLIVALLIANVFTGCAPQPESIFGLMAYQVDVGNTVSLNLSVLPEDVQNKALTFTSSAEDIASVDDAGTIKGISAGSAIVTAKAANGVSLDVDVTVTLPVDSVSAEGTLTLGIGQTGCVNAQIQPRGATDPTLTYLSDDEQVATVDETGLVTAISAGETIITITAHNGQQTKTIIVVETPVLEVQLDKDELIIYLNGTITLTAVVLPDDATHPGLTWESTDTSIVAVDEAGVVTGIALGEATITAVAHNGVQVTCAVTVIKQPASPGNSGGAGSAGGNGTGGSPSESGSSNDGGSAGGSSTQPPAPAQLTGEQIQQAVGEAAGYAAGLGFNVVGDRQPGHSIASVAYYDYGAFLQNLKDNVSYVASLFAGEDLSLVKLCFVIEGNSVYVTYG